MYFSIIDPIFSVNNEDYFCPYFSIFSYFATILSTVVLCFGLYAGSSPAWAETAAKSGNLKTVFLIVMENKSWSDIKGNPDAPYLNTTLLPQSSYTEQYKGPKGGSLHPSEPNYIWLEAGDTLGITDNADPSKNHQTTTGHLVTLLQKADVSWKSYQEDISGTSCPLANQGKYAVRHNPMVYFNDVTGTNDPESFYCIEHVRPLTELERDLKGNTAARYNFITPNLCNDMHDKCPPFKNKIRQGDEWLKTWIPRIQESAAYKNSGVIFIVWDEADLTPSCKNADCPIGMIVLSPYGKGGGYSNTIAYDHSSTLKTIQEIFAVTPLLGAAADSTTIDLRDLFRAFP